MQWNCQSLSSKKSDLIYLVNKFSPYVIALAETWLLPGRPFSFPSYSCIRSDRSDGYAGTALLIKDSIPFFTVSLPSHGSDFQAVAAKICGITFCSIYIPSPSIAICNDLDVLLASLPQPCFILGDFNCHNRIWGSSFCDSVGTLLLNIMDSYNFCVLNDGSPTYRTKPSENRSCVDLSFCSSQLASKFEWSVLSNSFGSRHFPILLQIPASVKNRGIKVPLLKHNLSNPDWAKFRVSLEEFVPCLPEINTDNIPSCHNALVKIITRCANKCFPLKNSTSGKISSPPWWDHDCTSAIKRRKNAEAVYAANMTEENFAHLTQISREVKVILKDKKSEGWKSFCSSISPHTHPSLVWQKIRIFRSSQAQKPSFVVPSQEWADNFMNKLAPPTCPMAMEIPCSVEDYPADSILLRPFSVYDLKCVLSSVKDSAPGIDGIPYSFLANASLSIQNYYLDLFNCIFQSGCVPLAWKTQLIMPILKPNKDRNDISSFRPIALSSVFAKVGEHLVKSRLEWFIENNQSLSECQFGFRKGKSTLDNLAIFTSDIRVAFSRNESVVASFLDVSSAYDNVCIPILVQKLRAIGVPYKIHKFINNLLCERPIHLRSGSLNIEAARYVYKGLPQGSVLSPLLYNVYTLDLHKCIPFDCKILQYADDILLYSVSDDLNASSVCINHSLNLLNNWLLNNGLELSPAKSSVVVFTRKRKLTNPIINIGETVVPVSVSIKFLGLVLDNKLTGKAHCEYVVAKCEKNLNILRCLAGCWWGSHPYSLKLLYNAIIRSVIDYGTFLLFPINRESEMSLDKIQYKALRIIVGAMKNSPKKSLQVECVDPPFKFRRQFISDRFLFRSLQFSYHTLIPIVFRLAFFVNSGSYWSKKNAPLLVNSFNSYRSIKAPISHLPVLPLFTTSYEAIIYEPKIILNFDIHKDDHFANKKFQRIISLNFPDYSLLFTDASKADQRGCVGVGVYHQNFNVVVKKKCPPEASVYSGECLGILEALKYIKMFKIKKSLILSDCRSGLQALRSNLFYSKNISPIIFKIKELLLYFSLNNYSVSLAWIPGHSGILGNERADRAAKEAIICGDLDSFMVCPQDLLLLPKFTMMQAWQSSWVSQSVNDKDNYSNFIQNLIPSKPWFFKFKFDKTSTSVLCRMRLGFCCSPAFLAKIRIKDSSLCECGLEEGNLNHIFLVCPLYDHSFIYDSLHSFPVNMNSLLSAPSNYSILVSFINNNKIKL